jgi:hypothetical protein
MTTDQQLPDDLLAYGYKLIVRGPGRMFAVSRQWGCTRTCTNVADVIRIARGMVRWCQYQNTKKQTA